MLCSKLIFQQCDRIKCCKIAVRQCDHFLRSGFNNFKTLAVSDILLKNIKFSLQQFLIRNVIQLVKMAITILFQFNRVVLSVEHTLATHLCNVGLQVNVYFSFFVICMISGEWQKFMQTAVRWPCG